MFGWKDRKEKWKYWKKKKKEKKKNQCKEGGEEEQMGKIPSKASLSLPFSPQFEETRKHSMQMMEIWMHVAEN